MRKRARKRNIQSWISNPELLADPAGIELDPWQHTLLNSTSDLLLCNVHRQGGKSLAAALLIIHEVIHPEKTIVILSASERQSKLLFKTCLKLWRKLNRPIKYFSVQRTYLELENGSVIYALPANPDTVRGISAVSLLVIDESSLVSNEVYNSIAPTLAVSQGRTVCLFTPGGKRPEHWLYQLWTTDSTAERIEVPASECSRISPEWLERERNRIGDYWFLQEYCNVFNDPETRVFKEEHILATFDENIEYDYDLFKMTG